MSVKSQAVTPGARHSWRRIAGLGLGRCVAVATARRLAMGTALCVAVSGGCKPSGPAPSGRTLSQAQTQLQDRSDVLIDNAAAALNDLPERVDLELTPPRPLLTASNSTDGAEVRATCTANPRTPANPANNYLRIADGNASFRTAGVRDGDLVRLYVTLAAEGPDSDLEQRTSLELTVRRLDDQDPDNALIIEGGLSAPVFEPQRIEIWRYSDKRMNEIRTRLARYANFRDPPVGWEPTPDEGALQQVVDRLNRWFRNQPNDARWAPSALLADLPEAVRTSEGVAALLTDKALRTAEFADWEGRMLQQAIWCRDIARWAKGGALDDAATAAALFEWTVRNVWLEPGERAPGVYAPWQALAYSRGTALDRAWAFVELCRQQRIDASVVAVGPSADAPPARLLVAAVAGEQLLLFDPEYGIALPSPSGAGAGSLQQLRAQPELLRQMDVQGGPAYPLQASDLGHVRALICAAPWQVGRRAAAVEDALEGDDFVTLQAAPEAQRDRLLASGANAAGLWDYPWTAFASQFAAKPSERLPAVQQFEPFAQRPQLWKARALHFQGDEQPRGDVARDPLAEPRRSHQQAFALYQDRLVRPPQRVLELLKPETAAIYAAAKRDAALWVGLLSYDRGNYETGRRWLEDLLLAPEPAGPRAAAARFALSQCYAELGAREQAVAWLDDQQSPQRVGNQVRARRLGEAETTDE